MLRPLTAVRATIALLSLALPPAYAQAQAPASPSQARDSKHDTLQAALHLPSWLSLSGSFRTRLELPIQSDYRPAVGDAYALFRLRFNLAVKPTSWWRINLETQDAHTLGLNTSPAPPAVSNPIDLRIAYTTLSSKEDRGPLLRLGRQELSFAGGWLISGADWSNTTRVFDAALAAWGFQHARLNAFSASVVQTDTSRLDRHRAGEHLHGLDFVFPSLIPSSRLETFTFLRTALGSVSELGPKGDSHLWTSGFLLSGSRQRLSYSAIYARQFGSLSSDPISAHAGDYMLAYSFPALPGKPRLSAEFVHASGDSNPKDGHRHTFDQLYGGLHNFLGLADRLGWRNSRNLRAGIEFSPNKRFKFALDLRDLSLATAADSLYLANGVRSLSNPNATSRHVGIEPDAFFSFQLSKNESIGGGLGYVFPGAFLKQSTPGRAFLFPYLSYQRKF